MKLTSHYPRSSHTAMPGCDGWRARTLILTKRKKLCSELSMTACEPQNSSRASGGRFRKDSHEKLQLSVNDLVREVLKLIHGDLERRQIILRTELHDALPRITGERVPLQQVLFNLIMNAIEAMSAVTERERQLTIRAVLN